jgi:hypothetical protein
VKVKRGEIASWRRGDVLIEPDNRRLRTGYRGGTLHIGGDRVPVQWDAGLIPRHARRVTALHG